MKAKLIVEGKEFPIEIHDPELQKLLKPQKKTGYERIEDKGQDFSCVHNDGEVSCCTESFLDYTDKLYETANYYSDKTIAENNARADKLMRQLRRFAVEHRERSLCWIKGFCDTKWSIIYDCPNDRLIPFKHWDVHEAFVVYFDSETNARLAIETFHDELIWYFTEYKDSL